MSSIVVAGDTSGSVTLSAPAIAGSVVITLPTTSGTMTAFASGTVMLFVQTAAPTGWTKSVANNDKALRVVSGAASTGGSVAFTTAFASGLSADAVTLSEAQMPAHVHTMKGGNNGAGLVGYNAGATGACGLNSGSTLYAGYIGSTGGGTSHAHTLPSFAVSYVDTIIATKD